MAVDYAFVATLNDDDIRQKLTDIDNMMDGLATKMNTVFDPLNKASTSFESFKKVGVNAVSAIDSELKILKQDLQSIGTDLQSMDVKTTTTEGIAVKPSQARGKNIFSQELQRLPNTTQSKDFVQQAARQTTTPDELEELVRLSGQFTNEQINSAKAVAQTRNRIENMTSELRNSDNASEDLVEKIKTLQNELEKAGSTDIYNKTADAIQETKNEANRLITAMGQFGEVDEDINKVAEEVRKLDKALLDAGTNPEEISRVKKDAEEQLKILRKITTAKQKAAEDNIKLQSRIEKAQLRAQKVAENTLKRQIKSIPEVKNRLSELADKYDGLVVPINASTGALTRQQQEVLNAINSDKRLSDVVKRLTKETGDFNLELKRTDFKKSSSGANMFKGALAGIAGGGVFLMIINGLKDIGRAAVRMATDATRALFALTVESAKIADQYAGQKIAFENILPEGMEAGANERLFREATDISRRLGVDASGIVSAILPFVDDIAQIDPFAETITELLSLSELGGDPKEQASAIRAVIDTLVEGNAKSIRQMFEITNAEGLDEVIALAKKGDTFNALQKLSEITAGRGVEFETFTETSARQLGILRENVRLLQGTYGEAINADFSQYLQKINIFMDENSEALSVIVTRLGEFVSEIAGLVGSGLEDFINNLDLGEVDKSIGEFINNLKSTKDQIVAIYGAFEGIRKLGSTPWAAMEGGYELFKAILPIVDTVVGTLVRLAGISLTGIFHPFESLKEILGIVSGDADDFEKNRLLSAENLSDAYRTFLKLISLIGGALNALFVGGATGFAALLGVIKGDGFDTLDDLGKKMEMAASEAFNEQILKTQNALDALDGTVVAIEVDTEGVSQADADIFSLDRLTTNIEKRKKVILETQALIDAELVNIQDEFDKDMIEKQRDHLVEQIDLEIKLHQQLEKMKREHLDDLKKLDDDADDDREDLALKHDRKLEDIANKRSKDERDLARDTADKKLKIEQDYLDKLAEMRRQFLFDANDAIRQNDAVAFLALKRKYEFDLNEARIAKENKDRDADADNTNKLKKIKDGSQDAIDAEKLANERSEADLQTSLDRKLQALLDAWEIEQREFAIKSSEQKAAMVKSQAEELDDLIRHTMELRNTIETTMKEEFDIINDGNDAIRLMEQQKQELSLQQLQGYADKRVGILQGISEGSLSQYLDNDTIGGTNSSSISSPSSSSQRGGSALQGMLEGAMTVARSKGVLADYADEIQSAFIDNDSAAMMELITLLNSLPAREMGGSIKPNQPYIVGEAGPEIFQSKVAGNIIPNDFASRLNSQTQATQATFPSFSPSGSVDNSKNIQVDLSMLDPSGFTQGQIAVLTSIIQRVILDATVGVS